MPASETCDGADDLQSGVSEAPQGSDASTVAGSFLESSSEGRSSHSRESTHHLLEVASIAWDDMKFAHRIRPYYKHAHCVADIHLLSCFIELAKLPDIESDAVKLLLHVLKFLRLCDYSMEDICSILAHASAYFVDTYALCGKQMDANEVGNVLATLIFIAHCYVQDETCPLYVWHRHLFRKYCSLKTLNAAVVRLLEIRHYKLRLEPEVMSRRFKCLLQAAQQRRAAPLLVDTAAANAKEDRKKADRGVIDCGEGIRQLSLGSGCGRPKRRQCTFSF